MNLCLQAQIHYLARPKTVVPAAAVAEVVSDGPRTLPLMFCATCFHTAEDGSKYCSTCRQAREAKEAKEEGEVAWNPLPEAAVWAPLSATQSQSLPAATVSLDSKALESLAPSVPRAESVTRALVPVDEGESDNPFSNPFGEPPVEALLPQPDPAEEEAEPSPLTVEQAAVSISAVESSDLSFQNFAIEPLPSRGNKEIVAMLAAGLLLLSVTAVAQVFHKPVQTPQVTAAASSASAPDPLTRPQASAKAASSGDLETAQRFMASAEQSMSASDFELAASQLGKAIEELERVGASEGEIASAKLLLAQAMIAEGRLAEAQALCAHLQGGPAGPQAQQLSLALQKAMLQQAEALVASGHEDLQAGRLTPATQKARDAGKLFSLAGTSPDGAEELRLGVERAEAGIGLQRPQTLSPDRGASVGRGQDIRAVRPRPTVTYQRPTSRPVLPPETGIPSSRPSSRPAQAQGQPETFPMATQMNRRPGQPRIELPPEQTGELPGEVPEQTQAAPPQGQPPAAQPGYESSKNRAGSDDVLPTYNSQSGGSVY